MANDPLSRNNVTLAGNRQAAKTLVFVNGLGTDQTGWSQVAPAFADDYRLVLFDNVGSIAANQEEFREHSLRYLNVSGYAADLLEICSALNLNGNTTLIGHSLGAMAGLLASVQRPQQFERLVLIGASPRYANTDGYVGGFSKADIDGTYLALGKNYSEWSKTLAKAAMGNPDRPSLANRFADCIVRIPQDMMLTVLCSVLQTDHRADLPKVAVPTLVVQSQEDFFVPLSVAEYLQANIPNCQLRVIEATGHLPQLSAPEKVVAAIRDFLRPG